MILLQAIYSWLLRKGHTRRLRLMVVMDEAHKVAHLKAVRLLMREGRAYGVAMVLASQQPSDFDDLVFSNAGSLLVMKLSDVNPPTVTTLLINLMINLSTNRLTNLLMSRNQSKNHSLRIRTHRESMDESPNHIVTNIDKPVANRIVVPASTHRGSYSFAACSATRCNHQSDFFNPSKKM